MIYLSEAVKNIIYMAQWSDDMNDDYGVSSRGKFSLFFWDNNKKVKRIDHPPSSTMPLMEVNEKIYNFTLFVSSHEHQFIDKDHLTTVDSDEPHHS